MEVVYIHLKGGRGSGRDSVALVLEKALREAGIHMPAIVVPSNFLPDFMPLNKIEVRLTADAEPQKATPVNAETIKPLNWFDRFCSFLSGKKT